MPRYHSAMCGRIDQNDIARLIADFGWVGAISNRSHASDSSNVAPGSYRPVMHMNEQTLAVDDVHWGYRASWAHGEGQYPVSINTRLEKIGNKYWRRLLQNGRAIVPANGWYEWTGEKGARQPWHIHRTDRAALYIAALANFGEPREHKASNGFTVVTSNAEGGLLDVCDWRPVVLSASDAALWLAPDVTEEEAVHIARTGALETDAFSWYMVDRSLRSAYSVEADRQEEEE